LIDLPPSQLHNNQPKCPKQPCHPSKKSTPAINTGNQARQLLEEALIGAPSPYPPQAPNPSLPTMATRGLANPFDQSFLDQSLPAQPTPTVDSRMGQQPTYLPAIGKLVVVTKVLMLGGSGVSLTKDVSACLRNRKILIECNRMSWIVT
jgi:hypothetical protein